MRKLRELQEEARYHVVARANRKMMIMATTKMKELFQNILARAKLKYRFRVENFCILGNHFHMIVQPALGESLSRIMQWIMSRFATAYNNACGLTGHVWGGRFFSKIIKTVLELIHTFSYIDDNPVKAGLAYEPVEWQYGGLRQAREGCHRLVDHLPAWMYTLFPRHQQTKLLQG